MALCLCRTMKHGWRVCDGHWSPHGQELRKKARISILSASSRAFSFPYHRTWSHPVVPSLTVLTTPQELITKLLKHVSWRTFNIQIKASNYTVAQVCNSSTQELEAEGLHHVQRQPWLQSKPSLKTEHSKTLSPGALPLPCFPVPHLPVSSLQVGWGTESFSSVPPDC